MKKLTEEEVLVLSEAYNLADGHAYRQWNDAEKAIIDRVSTIFHRVDRRQRSSIEAEYFDVFFSLSKQGLFKDYFDRSLCFTASTALEVIANYLRIKNMSVALIEPCFDNLYDILARHAVPMCAFPEALMMGEADEFTAYLQDIKSDAIFLVTPNNPTGAHIPQQNFAKLIDYCLQEQKLLIIDATFRFYLPVECVYDQYDMLRESGVDCFLIEDTGKTWPTLELKAPFFSASRHIAKEIDIIYSDFLLHVSPVAVALMTEFLKLPDEYGLGYIRKVIAFNRHTLYQDLSGLWLEPVEAAYMSVAWLRLPGRITAPALREKLAHHQVHVLAGNQFFWSDPKQGDVFIRVALARDILMFREASSRLSRACRE